MTRLLVTLCVTLSACSVVSEFDGYTFQTSDASAETDAAPVDDADAIDAGSDAFTSIDAAGTDAGEPDAAIDAAQPAVDASIDVDAAPPCCGGGCDGCGLFWCPTRDQTWQCQPIPCVSSCQQ